MVLNYRIGIPSDYQLNTSPLSQSYLEIVWHNTSSYSASSLTLRSLESGNSFHLREGRGRRKLLFQESSCHPVPFTGQSSSASRCQCFPEGSCLCLHKVLEESCSNFRKKKMCSWRHPPPRCRMHSQAIVFHYIMQVKLKISIPLRS